MSGSDVSTGTHVYHSGYLTKKSPSGIKGLRLWQNRYFILTDKALSYYDSESDKTPKGVIPFDLIIDAIYLPDKKLGGRFDVQTKSNNRVYYLNAENPSDAQEWVDQIKKALANYKKQKDVVVHSTTSTPVANAVPLTKVQKIFFKYKFNLEQNADNTEEIKKKVELFPSDKDILKFILTNVMDPAKGQFVFDLSDDSMTIKDEDQQSKLLQRQKLAFEMSKRTCQHRSNPSATEPDCPNKCIASCLYCPQHNPPNQPPPRTPEYTIIQMLCNKEFIRNVVDVFTQPDQEVHGLLVRLLWILFRGLYSDKTLATKEFTTFMDIYCSADKFHLAIKNALMIVLLSSPSVISQDLDQQLSIGFYMKVKNSLTFTSLFSCLKNSKFETRKVALEDIYSVLLNNFHNCSSFIQIDGWVNYVLNLLTDIHKEKKKDPVVFSCYQTTVGIIGMISSVYAMESECFEQLLLSTLTQIHQYGGSTTECVELTSSLLTSLVNVITNRKKNFSPNDYNTVEWLNLFVLLRTLKRFIFTTSFWNTKTPSYSIEDDESDSTNISVDVNNAENIAAIIGDYKRYEYILTRTRLNANDATLCDEKTLQTYSQQLVADKKLPKRGVVETTSSDQEGPQSLDINTSVQILNFSSIPIAHFGFHFNEDGLCVDKNIVEKVLVLMKALAIHEYDPEIMTNNTKEEKEFVSTMSKEYAFWQDALELLKVLERSDIEERRVITYRKVSFLLNKFLSNHLSKSDRTDVIKEFTNYKAQTEPMSGAGIYVTKEQLLQHSKVYVAPQTYATESSSSSSSSSSNVPRTGVVVGTNVSSPSKTTTTTPSSPSTTQTSKPSEEQKGESNKVEQGESTSPQEGQ